MLLRILTAGLLIPLVLAAIFYAPAWLFLGILCCIAAVAVWEFGGLLKGFGGETSRLLLPLALALPWVWFYLPPARLPFLVAGWLLLAAGTVIRARDLSRGLISAGGNLAGWWWIGLPLAMVSDFQAAAATAPGEADRPLQLVLVLVAVWACDSGAYFAGRALGRRRVTPRLSPKKTLAGFVAAPISTILAVALLAYLWFPDWGWLHQVVLGLVLAAAAVTGDLFESLLKRGAGIKDTSQLIPGHGGVLDRIDSLLFAFPAYYVVSTLL